MCVCVCVCVMVNAPDRSFDGDGEEEGFWHERGPVCDHDVIRSIQ